jgi:hypothetical protein
MGQMTSTSKAISTIEADDIEISELPHGLLKRFIRSIGRETKSLGIKAGGRLLHSSKAVLKYFAHGLIIHHKAKIGLNKHFSETGYYIGFFF